jgi:two-component system response regulator YesN
VIADDKKFIRLGIATIIQEALDTAVTIRVCKNGTEALEILKQEVVDLLITDIRMPEMDGIELMRQARELLPALKVIVVSGYDEFSYAQESIHYGASAYLLKPIDKNAVITAVRGVLEQTQERQREEHKHNVYVRTVEAMLTAEGAHNKETRNKAVEIDALPRVLCAEDDSLLDSLVQKLEVWKNEEDADIIFLLLYQNCVSLGDIYLPDMEAFLVTKRRYQDSLDNADYSACLATVKPLLFIIREQMLHHKRRHCDKADIFYAIKFIEANFDKDINLDMAANAASLNYSYFSHMFKEYTGESFSHYLTKIRISKAKELLSETSFMVYEIGERVGFQNDKHFMRSFKKVVGITPKEYRNSETLKKIGRGELH